MRKFVIFLVFLTVSFLAVSCSNFALPERVHIKTEINPNIPLNSESVNLGRQIQNELDKLFADDTDDVTVINYAPETDNADSPQKFLISFPMKDQSLEFDKYLADDGINENLESINQKFKLDTPKADDTKLSINMSGPIGQILSGISSPSIPVSVYTNQVNIPLTGFTRLSFHSGSLDITFSIPAGQNSSINLSNLWVNNSISSTLPFYTLSPEQRTVMVSFPLNGQTLNNNLTLTYTASSPNANNMSVATKIREDSIINKAEGVNFAPISNASISGTPIDLKMSSELIQAKIGAGSVALSTSALRNISLSLNSAKLTQAPNTGAPASYEGTNLQTGLNADLFMGGTTNLQGQSLNPNDAEVSGTYSMSVNNPATSEITFNSRGELEIPIAFSLESFSNVYVNPKTIIENFNTGSGSHVVKSLDDLSKTVTSLTYDEAGLKFTFGKVIDGLYLTVGSPTFFTGSGSKTQPIEADTTKTFTEPYSPVRTMTPKGATIEFDLSISPPSSNSILELKDVKAGEDVTILECTPEFVFHWTTAILQGGGDTVMEGDFPADGGGSFSLGGDSDNNLTSILKDLKFSDIKGYLFFIGPDLGSTNIRLDLTSYPDSENGAINLSENEKIEVVQTELVWPKNKEPYTDDIAGKISSRPPMDFTDTFNRMLPSSANPNGESLHMKYKMDFGAGGFFVTNDPDNPVKVFRTILVLVVPLELKAVDGDAHLNLSDQLEGMTDTNLLSFTEQDEGDSFQMDVNPLTLNIGLSGMPIEEGKIIITTKGGPTLTVELNEKKDISLPIADHKNNKGEFIPEKIELVIPKGKSLKITQGLSVLKFGVNVGLDVTLDL